MMTAKRRTFALGLAGALGWGLSGCVSTGAEQSETQASKLWKAFVADDPQTAPFVDFSHAGAFYGERAMPDMSGRPVFRPEDHGARADDGEDDTRAFQLAIDAAQRAGGGVVQLGTGRYLLNNDPTAGPLIVTASYVVLRGKGQSATELHMAQPMPPAEPGKKWSGPAMIRFAPLQNSAPTSQDKVGTGAARLRPGKIISAGTKEVPLSDASGFAAGDYVLFTMQDPAANASFLQGKRLRKLWATINEKGVAARETQRILEVRGDTLVLERSLLTALDPTLPWRAQKIAMLEQVGVQDLTFSSSWSDRFEHHKDARHDSGYRAIELAHTVDSWVSNVTFRNVSTAVSVRGGLANSVLLNTIEGNGGHFSFQVEFATRTLVGMNIDAAHGGQWHGPGASHMSVGTVVWRYLSPTSRGIDMHALFPRHTLIDHVTMKGFGGWGGNARNLPNHLGGLVIWNFTQTGNYVGNHFDGTLDFWKLPESDRQAYGFMTAINPVLAGYRGPVSRFNRDNAIVESAGAAVSPASLYEAQLKRRLGALPEWVTLSKDEWNALVRREYE